MPKKLYRDLGFNTEGITPTPVSIEQAFRRLANEYHPDNHPSTNKEKMKAMHDDVVHAFYILSDEKLRDKYDSGLIDDQGDPVTDHHGVPPTLPSGSRRNYFFNSIEVREQSRDCYVFEDRQLAVDFLSTHHQPTKFAVYVTTSTLKGLMEELTSLIRNRLFEGAHLNTSTDGKPLFVLNSSNSELGQHVFVSSSLRHFDKMVDKLLQRGHCFEELDEKTSLTSSQMR